MLCCYVNLISTGPDYDKPDLARTKYNSDCLI